MKKITCIVCPNSCSISVEGDKISGYKCKRGLEFASAELTYPKRSVTGTVKTVFKNMPVLPVKTKGVIPKDMVFAFMDELKKIEITRPVKRGDVLVPNVLETGTDVVATADIPND